jgi:S1-C subfamily serine protease
MDFKNTELAMIKKTLFTLFFLAFFILPIYAAPGSDLLAYEKNTIEVFQKSAPKVIYVHRLKTIVEDGTHELQIPSGAGSGIIWDAQGHIVTNFHVINGADKLAVGIGKETFPAKVIGTEPRKDIAVLAITSPKALEILKSFVPFEIAHAHSLSVGQKAIAIGNPFGLDHSLTIGVISALGRQMPGVGGVSIRDMIQTDASINPGNSGGPLLDSSGRLIGLNTLIFSQSGNSAGVGFAVPAEEISRMINQIIKNGRVVLAGIGIQRTEPKLSSRLGVKKGVLIADVLPNTPAAAAGLKGTYRTQWNHIVLGDIIVALNGQSVDNYDTLYNLLTEIPIGKKITVTVKRGNKRINFNMKTIDVAAL